MPALTIRSVGSPSIRCPSKVMLPRRGRENPLIVLSVVLLPEPLPPRSATMPPAGTAKLTPRSTSVRP
jgi:hypothetical protein